MSDSDFDENEEIMITVAKEVTTSERQEVLSRNTFTYILLAEDSSERDCSICLVEFKTSDRITRLPCGHLFHAKCIGEWCLENNTCPLCRVLILINVSLVHDECWMFITCNGSNEELSVTLTPYS